MVLNLSLSFSRSFSLSPRSTTQAKAPPAAADSKNQCEMDLPAFDDEVKEVDLEEDDGLRRSGKDIDMIEISLAAEDTRSAFDAETIDLLIECAKEGDLPAFQAICEKLEKRSLNADAQGFLGWTPAHWAAREGHVHILVYLHDIHANLDIVDKKGDTLLHKAASNGQYRVCQWLLEHGFNVQAKNNHQRTPLDLARQHLGLANTSEAALTEAILARENANTF